jgi:hypothetical protein
MFYNNSQSVYTAKGNYYCLFWDSNVTRKYIVRLKHRTRTDVLYSLNLKSSLIALYAAICVNIQIYAFCLWNFLMLQSILRKHTD